MDKPLNIFILAAGLGERLRPITNHIPKPLLPVLGKPVLQFVLERVSDLPVDKIGINLHHKKEIMEQWVKNSDFHEKVRLFPEDPVLGTGGALKNAEAFLNKGTFLVYNSDILTDVDLVKLYEEHLSSGDLVTLAMHDRAEFNHVAVDEQGSLRGIRMPDNEELSGVRNLAFTGVAVYSPEFLKFLPDGASGVVDAWLSAVSAGFKVGTLDATGCYWSDVGTPSSYFSAVVDALKADGETLWLHPSAKGCENIHLQGHVVIENRSTLEKDIFLKECILLSQSRTKSGTRYENCILGPGFVIDLGRSEDESLIGTGGSDRRYYRIKKDGSTAVLMKCTANDPDFERQIEYTRFFLGHLVPVPEIIEINTYKKTAVFEDLGDLSLYSWLKCIREKAQIEQMYKKIMDILVLIHTEVSESVAECPVLQNKVFDQEHFLWETEYFIDRFVKGISNADVKDRAALDEEFNRLASKADSFPKSIIHRDFQSQNIMITGKGTPRIIDYQGARVGPPGYDIASILRDPYYHMENGIRERLLEYYISEIKNKDTNFDEKLFRDTLLPCGLQRHMQALGAFGFLSVVIGKRYFLKYVPEGLKLLKEDLSESAEQYPALHELVMDL